MKIKKIFSVLIFCMVVCGSVGAIGFQRNTAYATPIVMVVPFRTWDICGEADLRREIPLVRARHYWQENKAISIINRCIRESRTLRVTWLGSSLWDYEVR